MYVYTVVPLCTATLLCCHKIQAQTIFSLYLTPHQRPPFRALNGQKKLTSGKKSMELKKVILKRRLKCQMIT